MQCNTNLRKILSFFIITTLIASATFLVVPEKASADNSDAIYNFKVEVNPKSDKYVDVDPDEPATAVIIFTITNGGLRPITLKISLGYGPEIINATVSCDALSLYPGTITLLPRQSVDVTCYLTINRSVEAPYTALVRIFVIEVWPWPGLSSAASAGLVINQYSRINIDTSEGASYSLEGGFSKTIDVNLTNQGNGADPILFQVANRDELIKMGFEVSEYPAFQLQYKESKTLPFTIKAPFLFFGDAKITLKATSQLKGTNYSQYYNITVKVNNTIPLAVISMVAILVIVAVDVKTHKIGLVRLIKRLKSSK